MVAGETAGKLHVSLLSLIAQGAIQNNTANIGRARWAHKMFVATLLALVSTPSDPHTHALTPNPSRAFERAETPLPEGRFIFFRCETSVLTVC